MGLIETTAIIRNPADHEKSWDGTFLVDTGAIDCVVPRSIFEGVGLHPRAERVYTLADGGEVSMEHTIGVIELMGEAVGATIVFAGDDNGIPPLGATSVESVGIEVDLRNECRGGFRLSACA